MKALCFVFLLMFSRPCWPLSWDWSGFLRTEGYYQHSSPQAFYSDYNLVLEPKIQVVDGLSLMARWQLAAPGQALSSRPWAERQTGLVVFYNSGKRQESQALPNADLRPVQIYMDYQSEFFKIRLGKAPYHFGLGASHSASKDPFQHWQTAFNQALLRLAYEPFYFQPGVFQKEKTVWGAAQAGLLKENWGLELFYKYSPANSFAELFGRFSQMSWELKGSASYGFGAGQNMALALEAFWLVPAKRPLRLEIKAGGALGDMAFHPNYDIALLFWNRLMAEEPIGGEGPAPLQAALGQIQKGLYVSPRLLFSFWNERLKLRPLFLLARDLDKKAFNYEMDLEGLYQLDESLFFSLKGGALYAKELSLALMAQAAVSF